MIKYILLGISVGKLVLFNVVFVILFCHNFTFTPFFSYVFSCISYEQHIAMWKKSSMIYCLLTGLFIFSSLIFIINIGIFGYFSTNLFYAFYLPQIFYIYFSLLSWHLWFIFSHSFLVSTILECIYSSPIP